MRQWLLESERWRNLYDESDQEGTSPSIPVDLHTVVSEWAGLKTELNLATRGTKSGKAQLEDAASTLRDGIAQLGGQAQQMLVPLMRERDDAQARLAATEQQWITVLVDGREALARGAAATAKAHRRLGWRRWFLPRGLFGGLTEGYDASLRRIDAALESCGVTPIDCIGAPVDPNRMRVVDVVPRGDHPAGHVCEEIRRGYVRGDVVIRHAEVRAVSAHMRFDDADTKAAEAEKGTGGDEK